MFLNVIKCVSCNYQCTILFVFLIYSLHILIFIGWSKSMNLELKNVDKNHGCFCFCFFFLEVGCFCWLLYVGLFLDALQLVNLLLDVIFGLIAHLMIIMSIEMLTIL